MATRRRKKKGWTTAEKAWLHTRAGVGKGFELGGIKILLYPRSNMSNPG